MGLAGRENKWEKKSRLTAERTGPEGAEKEGHAGDKKPGRGQTD